ncbi:hypothetical protein TB147_17805 [Klebsiella aerogenes]|uniref:hypothetical protein n=1 Tax=Klebsiella aerogenes TaxID=548 RepID=UPI002E351C53|nr:hypothetical protein [Klebsiella aerogenes]MED7793160.1 hypothetical protein [Klebsiella aerogenes]
MTVHDNLPGQSPENPEFSLFSGREPGQYNWMVTGATRAGKTLNWKTHMEKFLSRERDDE